MRKSYFRYIALSQPSSISQSPSGLQTQQQVVTTCVQNLQVLGSPGGRQVRLGYYSISANFKL